MSNTVNEVLSSIAVSSPLNLRPCASAMSGRKKESSIVTADSSLNFPLVG